MNQDYLEWKNWEAEDFGKCSELAEKYLSWHLRRACPAIPKRFNVLEVGFGNGQFLGFCQAHGFDVSGVEVNRHLVDRARAAGYKAVSAIDEAAEWGPFDLIAAFDVLEHLDSAALHRFFDSFRTLVADGGCLLVRVPNGDSPFARRYQHGDMTHVTTFGEFKFRQIAQKYELSVVAVGEAPWYIDEFERPTVKAVIRGALKKLIELLVGFIYYKQRVSLEPNLVVVLRKGLREASST